MRTKKDIKPQLITDLRVVKKPLSPASKIKGYFQRRPKLLLVAVFFIIIAVIAYMHWHSGKSNLGQVKSAVSKLMILPSDEQPTLATVTDKSKLQDKFLIEKAQNGDRILVYTKNRLVIIYRPSINKIAAVGLVSTDPALPEAKDASLTVVDGSDNPQKTQKIIELVKSAYPGMKVVDGGKIARQDLPTTLVIDNTNQKDYLVDALAQGTGGKRGVVPLGVDKVATDLMIIVGKD